MTTCSMVLSNVPGVVGCEKPALFRVLERRNKKFFELTGKRYTEHHACACCANEFRNNHQYIVEPINTPYDE